MEEKLQQLYEASATFLEKRTEAKLNLIRLTELYVNEIVDKALVSILETVQHNSSSVNIEERLKNTYNFAVKIPNISIPLRGIINIVNGYMRIKNGVLFTFYNVDIVDKKNDIIAGYISIERKLPYF